MQPKNDWRVWVKWISVVLVTALIARYTGREAVAPPPPTVLPFEAKPARAPASAGEVSGRVEYVAFQPGETGEGSIITVRLSGDTPEWQRTVMVSAEYRPGKHPTFGGKSVKTNAELLALLAATPRVEYTGSFDLKTYGVHTEGRFTSSPPKP